MAKYQTKHVIVEANQYSGADSYCNGAILPPTIPGQSWQVDYDNDADAITVKPVAADEFGIAPVNTGDWIVVRKNSDGTETRDLYNDTGFRALFEPVPASTEHWCGTCQTEDRVTQEGRAKGLSGDDVMAAARMMYQSLGDVGWRDKLSTVVQMDWARAFMQALAALPEQQANVVEKSPDLPTLGKIAARTYWGDAHARSYDAWRSEARGRWEEVAKCVLDKYNEKEKT
jgi:hypothetical protein